MGMSCAAGAADLAWAYREARKSDPVYAAAKAVSAMGQEKLPQARAALLPALTLSAYLNQNHRDINYRNNDPTSNASYSNHNVAVTATQPIFRYDNWIAYKQAARQVSQSEAILLQAEQDLIVRTAQAYFDVLTAENNVSLMQAQKAFFSEQHSQARRSYGVGTGNLIDAREAQARLDVAVYQEVAALNELEAKKQALSQIIGQPAPALAKFGFPFVPTLPDPATAQEWITQAQRSSLMLRIAQEAVDIAAQQVDRERSARLPKLDAIVGYANYGTGSGIEGGTGYDQNTRFVGLQFAMPLYLGGYVSSRVREASGGYDKAMYDLEAARRSVYATTRTTFFSVATAVAQTDALKNALISNQMALDAILAGRTAGLRTQVDVLNAQQLLIGTRRDYIQAIYIYALNVLKLKAAAGVLTEQDVAYENQWLTQK
jgi:outer membrane protein